jgi:hypothetical protein
MSWAWCLNTTGSNQDEPVTETTTERRGLLTGASDELVGKPILGACLSPSATGPLQGSITPKSKVRRPYAAPGRRRA